MEEWEGEDSCFLLESWARDGLTEVQIAENIGISARTLLNWKKKSIPIFLALKKGKEVSDFQVENALFKSAIEGNVTAQIFWLKNRKPERWRDKQEQKVDLTEAVKIIDSIGDGD
ncbi:MAG: helix-turn-helix domain-containing protein [Acetatifactor sp.]|nr:helix-turn-helix domain-containing protein [Acetatifactor sp.]